MNSTTVLVTFSLNGVEYTFYTCIDSSLNNNEILFTELYKKISNYMEQNGLKGHPRLLSH